MTHYSKLTEINLHERSIAFKKTAKLCQFWWCQVLSLGRRKERVTGMKFIKSADGQVGKSAGRKFGNQANWQVDSLANREVSR
jgi:hypothetical protein